MNQKDRLKEVYFKSAHVEEYAPIEKRTSMKGLYKSEQHTLKRLAGKFESVLDIGCCAGNLVKVIKKMSPNAKYTGVDFDKRAIARGKKINKEAKFVQANFFKDFGKIPSADLVLAFNVVDQYEDWKGALQAICRYSKKYVNFSSALRLEGESVTDEDLSYLQYSGKASKNLCSPRALWSIINVYSLTAFCASEKINAVNIYVYCYSKPIVSSIHPLHPKDLYIGNIVLEIDRKKCWAKSNVFPKVKIIANGKVLLKQ